MSFAIGGTTPMEREILTHYYVSPDPYKGGPMGVTEVHQRAIDRFLKLGLLECRYPDSRIAGTGKLAEYMVALAAVPLPMAPEDEALRDARMKLTTVRLRNLEMQEENIRLHGQLHELKMAILTRGGIACINPKKWRNRRYP